MADWFVRPNGTHNTTRNGLTYETAWGGWDAIVWGGAGVKAGDTLYVCGTYNRTYSMQMTAHGGTSSSPVTIRGDYATAPGIINFTSYGYLEVSQAWTTITNITIASAELTQYTIRVLADGVRVINCTASGGAECVHLEKTVIPTLFEVSGCHLSMPASACIGYWLETGSAIAKGIIISDNLLHDSGEFGIYIHLSGATAGTTSAINDVKIRNNEVYNTKRSTISFAGTTVTPPSIPPIYSAGLEITGNYLHDSGVIAGDNGTHGGMHVTGSICALIYGNRVEDCYVTGAGIQTLRNLNPIICFNYVSGIRSGTPTSLYQNGLPIDGNGIFLDNGTIGGIVFGNYITDLVTTGNVGSGCGLAIWDSKNGTYHGNIVENVACGAFYGYSTETGNAYYNNTFINCTVGIQKASFAVPAGNITVKNNIFINCTTGFATVGSPAIVNDYNCVYGSTTPYGTGMTAGANDISVNPDLDSNYRPRAEALKRGGVYLDRAFKDYYNKHFYNPPSMGAVEDHPTPAWSAVTKSG